MGLFEEYYSREKEDRTYASEEEAAEDIWSLVDIYLNLAARGRDAVQERLDMRGIVITPQEFCMALEDRILEKRPPQNEEAGRFRQMAGEEISLARGHIEGRTKKTRESGWEPKLAAITRRTGLNEAESLCFYLAAAVESDRKYERIYGYMQDNVAVKLPTVGLGLSLASMVREAFPETGEHDDRDRVLRRRESPLWKYLLEESTADPGSSRLSRTMVLREPVVDFLVGTMPEADFWDEIMQEPDGSLDGIGNCAFRVKLGYGWEDLILDAPQKQMLRHICDRVTFRDVVMKDWGFEKKAFYGTGVSTVFYGAPGTGKTMAAQVLAGELGMELYKIDLSRLVSKYIGETEKNLGEVFDQAKKRNVILFFDEADSLFARRSDVSGSNDRYANMETGYLLQRLEEYEGITVLATNLIQNLDDAFKRRIRFFIRFPFPDPSMRLKLWSHMLPEEALLEEPLKLEFYAERFELTGSDIREIVTSAAYLAAAKERGIRNEDIVQGLEIHYQRIGKRLTSEELGK